MTIKNLPAQVRPRFDPGQGRSPGEGNALLPISMFSPENPWTEEPHTVNGIAKSD